MFIVVMHLASYLNEMPLKHDDNGSCIAHLITKINA